MNEKRLSIGQRLAVDRKIGFALALLALMFVATLLDFGAGLWGFGGNNLLAFQAPLLLRRISFSAVAQSGFLSAPVGSGLAVLLLLSWIGVGYWMRQRDGRAFVTGVIALACDSCFLWLSLSVGRGLSAGGVASFVVSRVAVMVSWMGVWSALSTLRRQGYSVRPGQ